ncbi:MAG: acetate--CoA ligase family protein [Nitrospirota bacterium]
MTENIAAPLVHNENFVVSTLKGFLEKNRGKRVFLEHEVKGLLKEIGLSIPKGRFFRIGEAIPAEINLNYPLIAKVSSHNIVSKSEVRGLRMGLKNEEELRSALAELSTIRNTEGILVEETAPAGLEVIVGGTLDDQFGPVSMFGLGGIFVELFKDVAFALAPLSKDDAIWLVKQVKGYRLLEGYRGRTPVDINSLLDILIAVSELTATTLIKEIDLNPVALYPEGATILDAKMLINH